VVQSDLKLNNYRIAHRDPCLATLACYGNRMNREEAIAKLREGYELSGDPNRDIPFGFVHPKQKSADWNGTLPATVACDLINEGVIIYLGNDKGGRRLYHLS
jgi:hypothetical protein